MAITIPLRIKRGERVLSFSIKLSKNIGSFTGTIILLLVRTLSDKGTIIPKDIPLKRVEINIHPVANMNNPT